MKHKAEIAERNASARELAPPPLENLAEAPPAISRDSLLNGFIDSLKNS